jgi:hypothetical protein
MSTRNKVYRYDNKTGTAVEIKPKSAPIVDAPFVQDDTIPPTESHATDERKIFDSRQKLFEHYKQHGFECTGGSHLKGRHAGPHNRKVFESDAERARKAEWGMLKVDPTVRDTVAKEFNKTKWGMTPLTEREKERCSREEEIYQNYLKRQKA